MWFRKTNNLQDHTKLAGDARSVLYREAGYASKRADGLSKRRKSKAVNFLIDRGFLTMGFNTYMTTTAGETMAENLLFNH